MENTSLSILEEGLLVDKKMTDTPVAPQGKTIPSYQEIAEQTFGTLWQEAQPADWALIVHYMRTAPRSDTAPFNEAMAFLRQELQLDHNGDNASGAAPLAGWETGYCAGLRTAYRALKNHKKAAPLSPKSENSRDIAPMVPQTIRENSNTTSAGCVSGEKFRKKPVVIEAVKFSGNNYEQVKAFLGYPPQYIDQALTQLRIYTLEGQHVASVGDWIIKGVKGEFYACKPDIFAMTYEPAAAPVAAPSGCVSVPREPTEAMIKAGGATPKMKIINGYVATAQLRGRFVDEQLGGPLSDCAIAQCYRAMLAAAPVATQEDRRYIDPSTGQVLTDGPVATDTNRNDETR